MSRLVQITLIFLAANARASDPACESAASLRAKVKACEDNLAYATAGKACLDGYDRTVAAAREGVATALGAVLSSDKQSIGMANARKGYDTAIASLSKLAEKGRALGREVEGYRKELAFPDDFGATGKAGLPADIFLDHQHCYADTRRLVTSYAELLGLHAKELDLTKDIAAELAAKAFRGESALKPEDVLPLLTNHKAPGGKAPKGKPAQGQSDITGTNKKDKAPGTN